MRNKIISLASSTIALLSLVSPVHAQAPSGDIQGFDINQVSFPNLGQLMSNALALLFFFAGLLTFVFIVIGGIQWITAGGDVKAAQAARDRITAAVVGLIVVVAAFAITLILGQVFGINLFNFKFPTAPNTVGG
ncbi:MAG TPA: hypothetical protein VLE47_04240 [Candidatus Saccharimonadales bacterium]|nr:hypothetical protein [Candidatus Saccharimonadales bacterium]